MKSNDIAPYLLLILFGMMLGVFAGRYVETNHMKEEAIRAGHAEWVADEIGKPQFKWKECK